MWCIFSAWKLVWELVQEGEVLGMVGGAGWNCSFLTSVTSGSDLKAQESSAFRWSFAFILVIIRFQHGGPNSAS